VPQISCPEVQILLDDIEPVIPSDGRGFRGKTGPQPFPAEIRSKVEIGDRLLDLVMSVQREERLMVPNEEAAAIPMRALPRLARAIQNCGSSTRASYQS
jgi:hypothetical protein